MKIKKTTACILAISILSLTFSGSLQAIAETEGDSIESNTEYVSETQQSNTNSKYNLTPTDSSPTVSEPTETKQLVINDKDTFSSFMKDSQYWSSDYSIILACDLDLKDSKFKTIKQFNGKFDGGGHTISNLKIENSAGFLTTLNISLIGTLAAGSEFKNVIFDSYNVHDTSVFVHNSDNVAGLAISNEGTISNVTMKGVSFKLSSIVSLGGLVVTNESGGLIENCFLTPDNDFILDASTAKRINMMVYENKGEIKNSATNFSELSKGDTSTGFVQYNRGNISNCESNGSLTSYKDSEGFVEYNYGYISNCKSTGDVYSYNAGGFVHGNCVTIVNCSCNGNVSCAYSAGGFVYKNDGEIKSCVAAGSCTIRCGWQTSYCGGFVTKNESGTIEGCKATGNANGYDYVGGFAGKNYANILNCSAKGKATAHTVTASDFAGGFVGYHDSGTISGCSTQGDADCRSQSGPSKAGGFAGGCSSTITNSTASGYIYLSSAKSTCSDDGCGGFVGKLLKGGNISNCYAEARVETTNKNKGGGFVGEAKKGSSIHDSICKTSRVTKSGVTKAEFCYKNSSATIERCTALDI